MEAVSTKKSPVRDLILVADSQYRNQVPSGRNISSLWDLERMVDYVFCQYFVPNGTRMTPTGFNRSLSSHINEKME